MGCSTSIACYPAKIPHFLDSFKILAFYAIYREPPLITCESFIQALFSGFEGVEVKRIHRNARDARTGRTMGRSPDFGENAGVLPVAVTNTPLSANWLGFIIYNAQNRSKRRKVRGH
jgi:hypothetical protein